MTSPARSSFNPQGAYATLKELLRWQIRGRDLNLANQHKILAQQSGAHHSRFRGRGMNFSEVRAYQPGDDIRSIHWRVTARTQKPHTKVFSEEREQPTLLVVDQRTALFFGTQVCFKSALAAHLAALLGWAAHSRGDRVGGLVFNDQQHQAIRSKRSKANLLHLMQSVADYNQMLGHHTQATMARETLSSVLEQLRRTTKPGSELFIISDFHDFDADCQRHIRQLAQHNDTVCIQVFDPIEFTLPPPGLYPITDGNQQSLLDWQSPQQRRQFEEQGQQQRQLLRSFLLQQQVPLLEIATTDDPMLALQQGLGTSPKTRVAKTGNQVS